MSETNFQPLFEYMDEQFGEIRVSISSLEIKVDKMQTSMDSFAKTTKDIQEEVVVINKRLEILEAK